MALSLTDGWTEGISYKLTKRKRNAISASARNLTGHTVAIVAVDKNGNSLFTRNITIADAINGEVLYSPQNGDIVKSNSPMEIKFKVTDGSGKISYHPMGKAEIWEIF